MSTAVQPVTQPAGAKAVADDPYRLGWRYVKRRLEDGKEVSETVPLTKYDVLHPQEEDFIVNTEAHDINRDYLGDVFRYRVAGQEGALILCDHRIAWDVPDLEPLGPDIMAIFNVRPRTGARPATFQVADEGTRPAVIIEVTSPSTRSNDLTIKVDYYYRAGIPYYVIVDIIEDDHGATQVVLMGYQRNAVGYVHMTPDERGWLWLEPLQLWLAGKGGRAVCFKPDGKEIFDYVGVAKDRDSLAARTAQAEAQAAQEAQARAQAEAQAAQEAQARAQAEAQAAQEAQARADAERKLRELEEELRRVRGQK